MKKRAVSVIHHTHWDREWFLTYVYTSRWIPKLIKKLEEITSTNKDYTYLLDGQTLVIDDLLAINKNYLPKVKKLIKSGNLIIGPYFCQPDWRLVAGESLLRNLELGVNDMQKLGGKNYTGWLVDTFGHISQTPQIHKLFNIDSIYVWRGVRTLSPVFNWLSPDNSKVTAINLIGGYRNLYGVTKFEVFALDRILGEVTKLQNFYKDVPIPIPLFNGYDLEFDPEDTISFYKKYQKELDNLNIKMESATPESYAQKINKLKTSETISGELMSGKYASVFSGTLSTRTYLKVLNNLLEELIYKIYEPLLVLAATLDIDLEKYIKDDEKSLKLLLSGQTHDCICGVSIDMVHERMEYAFEQLYNKYAKKIKSLLEEIMQNFKTGLYSYNTSSFNYEKWVSCNGSLCKIDNKSIGLTSVKEILPIEIASEILADNFKWKNEFYSAQLSNAYR